MQHCGTLGVDYTVTIIDDPFDVIAKICHFGVRLDSSRILVRLERSQVQTLRLLLNKYGQATVTRACYRCRRAA
ncbi:MAG: hypothetical protein H3C34_00720 [Caldilineaceae bacterium]|nr:hypothetical protein [Caldilineaceae bacterium]